MHLFPSICLTTLSNGRVVKQNEKLTQRLQGLAAEIEG
jgi:hypothetical protein